MEMVLGRDLQLSMEEEGVDREKLMLEELREEMERDEELLLVVKG